jgi:hypothetical protein
MNGYACILKKADAGGPCAIAIAIANVQLSAWSQESHEGEAQGQ